MDDDFDYNDTATAPAVVNDFLLENLCGRKGQQAGGYSPPAPRSASKRWKALNEQNMMLKLEEKHIIKKQNVQKSKEQAREIIRKIPVEVLAKEWLSKEDATVDMRAYLVDNVLPTLILGVEKLLKEVDEKGLSATNRYEPEFNPINFLAQYLMRNNPRFSNFSEASPYVRGLREVSEEIKQELFTFEDNRLARIKAEARRKRAERERLEQQQQEARLKRMEQLISHFQQWSVALTNYKVELAMVQNALRSFCEVAALWPKEMREAAKFDKPLEPTDETGKMLSAEEFARYLTQYVEELSMDIFDAFMTHMNKCAAIYRAVAEKEVRRNILTNLFLMCDHGRKYNNMLRIIVTKELLLGLLDRQRILELFEKFWDSILQSKEFMGTLRNPRRFPVIEVDELDDSMFDAWEEEPDGGLTLSEMQIASAELAKVQQEVHRIATIATVQDKSAVEKWKIKQLSEKSEGMRWKLYKYNVTDFMNIIEYNYFDTLEAPKQNLNLQERIEAGNMRHHDLHQMTTTRTREERDAVLGRVKNIEEEEDASEADVGAVENSHPSVFNINENKRDNTGEQSFNNNSRLMAEGESMGSNSETNSIAFPIVGNTMASAPAVYYNYFNSMEESQEEQGEEPGYKIQNKNNNMGKFKNDPNGDSSSDTDTTVTELGLYSNELISNNDDLSGGQESELTSDEAQTSEDQNASDATFEESDEEVWFEKLSHLRKTLANVLPASQYTSSSRTVSSSKDFSRSTEQGVRNLTYLPDRSTTQCQPLPPIPSKKHVRFQSTYETEEKGTQYMDNEDVEGDQERATGEEDDTEHHLDSTDEKTTDFETKEVLEESENNEPSPHKVSREEDSTGDNSDQKEQVELNVEPAQQAEEKLLNDDDVSEKSAVLPPRSKTTAENAHEGVEEVAESQVKNDEMECLAGQVTSQDDNIDTQTDRVDDKSDKSEKNTDEKEDDMIYKEGNEEKEKDLEKSSIKENDEAEEKLENDVNNKENNEAEEKLENINSKENDEAEEKLENVNNKENDGGKGNEVEQENFKEGSNAAEVKLESEKELEAQKEEEKEKDELDSATGNTGEMNKSDSLVKSQQEGDNSSIDAESKELLRKLSLPVGDFLTLLYKENNLNFNKQLADINANSCNRVRNITILANQRSQSQLSAFDENNLNISQFVLLVETLLGHDPSKEVFEKLIKHIKDGYTDTEQEKMDRLVKTRKQVISAKRKLMIDNLFEKWDNDGSGYLEMEEIQEVLFKYKDGQELDVIKRAQAALRKKSKFYDHRLSKQEFRELIELVVKEMAGSDNFEQLVEFLMNSVERSYAERIRGEARKKWLQQIISAGKISGTLLDPVYKAVFQALYKDAEMHGGEKRISANIAMLENNKVDPSRGPLLLRYAACTPEDCQYMLGKALFKNMKGVSFQALETGKPVHVPRVSNHGNIYFWNYNRTQEEKEGSLVIVPLKDKKKRVFGTLGIDTVQDLNKKAIFITHEIQFFQGVAKAFSIAYHTVETKRKLLRVAESALSWMKRRCPHIVEITIYLVEPSLTPDRDPVLRKMMVAKKGPGDLVTEVVRLERKDNLFRDYLFQCMENSETVCADAYGERHTALPLRDLEGKAIGVVDISIGEMKQLPPHENKEAQRMLRLLQRAVREIIKEAQGEEKKKILDAESDESCRVAIMFDSLMLSELRENVSKLDPMALAELKSYYQPPKVILEICRAALAIFDIERAGEGQYEDWPIVKNNIHLNLIHQIKTYDPTKPSESTKTEKIARYLRAIPHGEVGRYGSVPAMLLYNWVFCCLSLIEHTAKMREMESENDVAYVPDAKISSFK